MTQAQRSKHWAQIGESTFVLGLWFLYGVHRLLGRVPFRVFLYPVVLYYWATRRVARHASREYLQQMHAHLRVPEHQPTWRNSVKHFLSFAETLLDKTLVASGRYNMESVRFEGERLMHDSMQRREGGVFVTAHMGCLELCQALAQQQPGLRIHVLVHTKHAQQFNRVLRRLNPNNGVALMQVTEITPATAMLLAEKVAQGEYVAIAGDRVPVRLHARACVPVMFLGREALLPIGPYVLASLLKCPLFLLGCIREGKGHTVVCETLAEQVLLPRGQRLPIAQQWAQRYAQRLEVLLARAPYEWFNFFPFWASTEISVQIST